MPQTLDPSERLLEAIRPYDSCLVVMHDNPDPDAIAAGWAIVVLIREKIGKPCRLVAGGAIVRAENRQMVNLLSPPVELVDDLAGYENSAAILVDCGLGTSNHLIDRASILPVGVVDHHSSDCESKVRFHDLRPDVAAAATIAASYLREQGIQPCRKLATALIYAIRTETVGYEFHFSKLDRSVLPWLYELAEPSLLAEIECAALSRPYFADLVLALQNAFVYADVALCILPRAEGVEIVGEVADLLIRCEGVDRVFCATAFGSDVFVSVRTKRDADDAAYLLDATLKEIGRGGGHSHRAGGKVAGAAKNGNISDVLEASLRKRWLAACRVDSKRGTRLIPRREIVEHL